MSKASARDWRVESVRLSAFPDVAAPGDWRRIVGAEPEIAQSRPREQVSVSAGPVDQGWLILEEQPTRTDWRLTSNPAQGPTKPWPEIGSLDEVREDFQSRMQQWLGTVERDVERIAFGAVLIQPAEDRSAALNKLQEFIPRIDLKGEVHDFLLRINRRRPYGEAGPLINRISTWSVVETMGFMLHSHQPMGPRLQSRQAAKLELDVNTVPQDETLARSELVPLFASLIDMGVEIAENGDTE